MIKASPKKTGRSLLDEIVEEEAHSFLEKNWNTFIAIKKHLMKSKGLSPHENAVSFPVWSSIVANGNIHLKSRADLHFFNSKKLSISGKASDDSAAFELKCLASKTILVEAIFFSTMKGSTKLVLLFGFLWGVEPVWLNSSIFHRTFNKAFSLPLQ